MSSISTPPKKPSVVLLGSYGRGNLGDDVFLEAAAELFTGHKLYVNSSDDSMLPVKALGLVSTISTNGIGDILAKLKVFWEVKNIVYWGGDLWVELYGSRWLRESLYKMVALNLLARLFGKRIHYVGCGIGRINGRSLQLARLSARLSHTIMVRERRSAEVLALPRVMVLPDLAINLPYFRPRLHRLPRGKKPFVIGISILYYLPDPLVNFPKLNQHLAAFIDSLPASKFKVILLPMLISAAEPRDDLWALQQLKASLSGKVPCEIYQSKSLSDMIETFGSLNLMIGTRLHANILAAFNATPCLGIAYRAKVSAFFHDNSLRQYCIDLESLEALPGVFWNMYREYKLAARQFYDASQHNALAKEAYKDFAAAHD